jgi:bifunctional non-homologous end joining protein LigD
MTKAVRKGKIFVDFFRNDYTATAVADFSVRARPGAPVAVPLEWREFKRLNAPNQFSIEEVIQRIKKRPPAPDRYKLKQRIRRK